MERRLTLKKALVVSVATFVIYLVYVRLTTTEEDRIMAMFAQIEEALEDRDSMAALEHISANYRDTSGRRKTDIRLLLNLLNRSSDQVMVSFGKRSIKLGDNNTAGVRLQVSARVIMNGREFEPLPEKGATEMVVDLRKEDGEWRVAGATYPSGVEEWIRRFRGILSGVH